MKPLLFVNKVDDKSEEVAGGSSPKGDAFSQTTRQNSPKTQSPFHAKAISDKRHSSKQFLQFNFSNKDIEESLNLNQAT